MNLRRMIKLKPPRISGIECDNTFVIQEFEKATDNLITNAPQEVAAALDEQDQGYASPVALCGPLLRLLAADSKAGWMNCRS
jgi:hypothetical protein